MVGTSRDIRNHGYHTVETESWLELQGTGIYHSRNRIMVGTSKDGCITVETESWLELQGTGIYHSRNRIMVGTSRNRDISQYKQNHGWNFKRQGYITVETESWLELQGYITGIMVITYRKQNHGWNFKRQGYITVETESWLELQETDVSQDDGYHSTNRIMVGTSRDSRIMVITVQ